MKIKEIKQTKADRSYILHGMAMEEAIMNALCVDERITQEEAVRGLKTAGK